jgi:hypothetical protein
VFLKKAAALGLRMRFLFCLIAGFFLCAHGASQTVGSDGALLAKTRALYDAPFLQGLVSFDCAVKFDWKQHFLEVLPTIPPAAVPTIDRLQTIQHRVFVDLSGAVVSSVPKPPDLSGIPKATELEQVYDALVPGGINAWMPFGRNVILPDGPTHYNFEKIDSGYKVALDGAGVVATLLLAEDLRITSGVSQLPQATRFTTEFIKGTHGFLLSSLKTADTNETQNQVAEFSYTYQDVDGFQIPSRVMVKPSTSEAWNYELTDCKVMKGMVIKVGLPHDLPSTQK